VQIPAEVAQGSTDATPVIGAEVRGQGHQLKAFGTQHGQRRWMGPLLWSHEKSQLLVDRGLCAEVVVAAIGQLIRTDGQGIKSVHPALPTASYTCLNGFIHLLDMKRLIRAIVFAVVGYLLCAVVSYGLVLQFSPRQDRALEAAMTSVFFYGPVGSAFAFAIGLLKPL
jgi:hypothetical protein